MKTARLLPALALALVLLAPTVAVAQDDGQAPEIRVLQITTFYAPQGEERQKMMQFINRVIAPQARNNVHVLSYRVATHFYGANSTEIKLITEYPDWESVAAPCGEPCQTWAEENIPEEGTPEREEFDEQQAAWLKLFLAGGHSDEIYNINMSRAK